MKKFVHALLRMPAVVVRSVLFVVLSANLIQIVLLLDHPIIVPCSGGLFNFDFLNLYTASSELNGPLSAMCKIHLNEEGFMLVVLFVANMLLEIALLIGAVAFLQMGKMKDAEST